jgi:2-hydroxychromene-2-carboxylate isomerase
MALLTKPAKTCSPGPRVTRIEFFYGIGSRYSYLSSFRLEGLAREAGAEIEWLPLNSVRLLEERGYSPFEHVEVLKGQYSAEYRERDAQRWAALYGVPFQEPRRHMQLDPELLATAATAGKLLGKARELTHALFAAVFHGRSPRVDRAACIREAVGVGLDAAEFEQALASEGVAAALDEAMLRAHLAGVFGVPTFVVEGEQFWGNDRLPLLAEHLRRTTR